jgi:hypothetical protein
MFKKKKKDHVRIDHEFYPCQEKYRYNTLSLVCAILVIIVIASLLIILFNHFV